jgi:prevent-host-death family protein
MPNFALISASLDPAISQFSPSEDIRSVTELKRSTREILDHLHATGRPVILTVNGKADSVLLDVRAYERLVRVGNPTKPFPATRVEDGLGCTGYRGPAKTPGEMDAGIDAHLRKVWQPDGEA